MSSPLYQLLPSLTPDLQRVARLILMGRQNFQGGDAYLAAELRRRLNELERTKKSTTPT